MLIQHVAGEQSEGNLKGGSLAAGELMSDSECELDTASLARNVESAERRAAWRKRTSRKNGRVETRRRINCLN